MPSPSLQQWQLHWQKRLKDWWWGRSRARELSKPAESILCLLLAGWSWLVPALQFLSHPLVLSQVVSPGNGTSTSQPMALAAHCGCTQVLWNFPWSSLALQNAVSCKQARSSERTKSASCLALSQLPLKKERERGREFCLWEPDLKRTWHTDLCGSVSSCQVLERESNIFGHR